MSFSFKFEDEEVKKLVNENIKQFGPKLDDAVKSTTADGLRIVKEDLIADRHKRTGSLVKSYSQRKIGNLAREIYSNLAYAESLESGYAAHTVYPKRAKFLTIPVSKSAQTKTGAQISKGSLDKLFNALKRGATMQEAGAVSGVVLAKKANIPAFSGTKMIQKKTGPKIADILDRNVKKAIEEVMG